MRRALNLRDRGCAFPGCQRPPAWCDGHHIVSWAVGGTTGLDNGVLLCGHHHSVVHGDNWAVRLAADGIPEFIPPAWIDPQRTPRRNSRHRPPDP
ncbi:MAG: HNH endonuclease signature motif containing protein [Geodermatophilaceae bacterium]